MTTTALPITNLDYDDIKSDLIAFMRNQTEFSDYDFEGSGLSILNGVLAYNTHYNAILANMVVNEDSIGSAVKRSSIAAHADFKGYLPASNKSSVAVVNIYVYGAYNESYLVLDKYTNFTSSYDNSVYNFITDTSYTSSVKNSDGIIVFENVKLKQGNLQNYSYTVQSDKEKYRIPSLKIDVSTLVVSVKNSNLDTTSVVYTYQDNIVNIDGNSTVYYLKEGMDGYYYIYFGDNILGKNVSIGNIIEIKYIINEGVSGNASIYASQTFSLVDSISGYSNNNVVITTTTASSGGGDKESDDSVRFSAIKNYQTQGRYVNINDYYAIKTVFPSIQSLNIWGGEDNTPPVYGKVFLAVKPAGAYIASDLLKSDIKSHIKTKNATIIPEIIDPNYIFIHVECQFEYNDTNTTLTKEELETKVRTTIQNYFAANLGKFKLKFYYSKLLEAIDNSDAAINGSDVKLTYQQRIEPINNISSTYEISYGVGVVPYSVSSSAFKWVDTSGSEIVCVLQDSTSTNPPDVNGTGVINLYDFINKKVVKSNIGTIDYKTGNIVLDNFIITGYPVADLVDVRISIIPQIMPSTTSINKGIVSETASLVVPMTNYIMMLDDSVAVSNYNLSNGLIVTGTPIK